VDGAILDDGAILTVGWGVTNTVTVVEFDDTGSGLLDCDKETPSTTTSK